MRCSSRPSREPGRLSGHRPGPGALLRSQRRRPSALQHTLPPWQGVIPQATARRIPAPFARLRLPERAMRFFRHSSSKTRRWRAVMSLRMSGGSIGQFSRGFFTGAFTRIQPRRPKSKTTTAFFSAGGLGRMAASICSTKSAASGKPPNCSPRPRHSGTSGRSSAPTSSAPRSSRSRTR